MIDQNEGGPSEVSSQAHVIQAKDAVRQAVRPSQEQQIDLEKLIEVAEPLVRLYFDADAAKHEREIAYDTKELEYATRRDRNLTIALTLIVAGVLVFSGYLIVRGQQGIAVDLIGRLVSIAGAAFGAYGFAQARRHREEGNE